MDKKPNRTRKQKKYHREKMKEYRKDTHYRDKEKVWYWKEKLASSEANRVDTHKKLMHAIDVIAEKDKEIQKLTEIVENPDIIASLKNDIERLKKETIK